MQTVIQIITEAGGLDSAKCISIDNEPWMRLVIEVLAELGPDGLPVVSVAHYGEENFDLMRDPEIMFQVVIENGGPSDLRPFYFRNDYAGVEQWTRHRSETGGVLGLPRETAELAAFAQTWDKNLRDQGFLEASRRGRSISSSPDRSGLSL
jgi:hypothetical protein